MIPSKLLTLLHDEHEHATAKHDWTNTTKVQAFEALQAEVNELAAAMFTGDARQTGAEAMQVATVALRIVERFGGGNAN